MSRLLTDNLVYDGFEVDAAGDVAEALAKVQSFAPHLVLLDLMLRGGDGFDLCRELATRPARPPVIILSARGQKEDKVRGLNVGADDYVTKPFDLEELLARIHAVLRRQDAPQGPLVLGDVTVDFGKLKAFRGGSELSLSHREFRVLQYLAERPGRIVSRDELLQAVWGYREAPLTRAVDISIARLRRKIEPNPHHPLYIRTMHGDGYSLTP